MAVHEPTTPVPLPVTPRALIVPYVLTPGELAGLLRIGEALANIQVRLAAMMARPDGPLAGELRDLATLTIDLLDVATPDPDLEPYLADAVSDLEEDDAAKELSLEWSANVAQLAFHS